MSHQRQLLREHKLFGSRWRGVHACMHAAFAALLRLSWLCEEVEGFFYMHAVQLHSMHSALGMQPCWVLSSATMAGGHAGKISYG
jgi:hypothetical protein